MDEYNVYLCTFMEKMNGCWMYLWTQKSRRQLGR